MSDQAIADGDVVSIHYRLKTADGTEVDSSAGRDPLLYLQGQGQIVPGLEKEIAGHKVGDEFDVVVSPDEGYGQSDPDAVQEIPRDQFPEDLDIKPGMSFRVEDQEGNPAMFRVLATKDDTVTADFNHPLAGEHLHFHIEVCAVRESTEEERSHGHAHGDGGVQH